jgi:protoporphyrinogen oxidase
MSEQRRKLAEEDGKGEFMESLNNEIVVTANKKKIVVVGGGWAGWGAVKTLCQCAEIDAHVILLDVLPDPTGKIPYLSKSGKPVEAGTRGFWKDYPNINALCKELGLDEHDVFTPFTNSSFYS